MTFIRGASPLQRALAALGVSCAAFSALACTARVRDDGQNGQQSVGGTGTTGGNGGTTTGVGGSAASGGTDGGAAGAALGGAAGAAQGGSAGAALGGSAGTALGGSGGNAGSPPLSSGGVKPRLLTRSEYLASLNALFGSVTTALDLPADTSIGGLIALGASQVTVNATAADKYEIASRAVVSEVFGDAARWQVLVGCQPQPNLSDACVETFARTFGRKAFRRDLTGAELDQWIQVARNAAALAGNEAQGLSTLVSGFLQSPNFLYRVETNALDPANGRLKYDGPSMAVRLAYFITGGPPSAELLAAGESGQLDTADGVRAQVSSMLNDAALVGRLTAFFYEYTQAELVMTVEKSPVMFPGFTDGLRTSMREGARLFLERVVLAPGADVRAFFDSDQTFADATLAPIYGVAAPSSGFAQFKFPQAGRAGIMGQAGIIAAHSKPDHSSPTARGVFMMRAFLCTEPEPLPAGVDINLPADMTKTTREKLEMHRSDPKCAGCHAVFDPMGLALEHFDSIGRYRETEDGLAIDATGTLEDGTPFDGGGELGTALRNSNPVTECLLRNFYRNVNGREDDRYDQPQVDGMIASLSARNYVFRDMVADFVVSDAFRSAPALPLTGGNQ
jgi:hypothetical protein